MRLVKLKQARFHFNASSANGVLEYMPDDLVITDVVHTTDIRYCLHKERWAS
ncbi:20519_t:CDS:2, partial [Rhizophagus irregularis]